MREPAAERARSRTRGDGSGFCEADVIAICNTQISLVKLDMANIDDLTDASVSAMQKLTSLVDLSLLYCLDYPLSGEAPSP